MREFHINFSGNLKKYLIFSGIIIAVILLATAVFKVELDIQFRGGSIITYSYVGELDSRFDDVVGSELPGSTVQFSSDLNSGTQTAVITLPGTESLDADALNDFSDHLRAEFGDNNLEILEITNVDATMGKEFLQKSVCALILAVILMLLYVAWRFRKIGGFSAGAMGIVALLHDCIVLFGVFVICRIPINSNFIAGILTIIGYSLNDTIVIYDRIRENRRIYGSQKPIAETVTLSINQSLIRSINTTVTTVMAMLVVTIVAAVYQVESILSFSLPLIVGLVSGTYSSVCLAGPLWVKWQERKEKQK